MPTLERHIRHDNADAYRERVAELEKFFQAMSGPDARKLLTQLEVQRPNDKLSKAFWHFLSTPSRSKLLAILRRRLNT